MINPIFLIFYLLINIFIIFNLKNIAKIIDIYDFPDKKRKLHKYPVPLIGGVVIAINFLFIIIIQIDYLDFGYLIIFIFSLLFFLIGLLDDKLNISPSNKFFFNIVILLIFFSLNESFLISDFNFLNRHFRLNYFTSYFFSILCVLLFINAMNLFDGINLQSIFYSIVVLSFLVIKNLNLTYFLFIIFVLLYLTYFNYKNLLFLGDNGIYLLSSFIAFNILSLHNVSKIISADEILIIMMVPGFDMMRLFLERLKNMKNPFHGDRNHLHHLLLDRIGYNKTLIVLLFLIISPIILLSIININIIIILYIITYLLILRRLNRVF